ncbi:hypothetical protein [Aquimarina sp. RZ0]|uniref:hypothetical protein n=1 Tax=Aquimarina sp. RZ0 TaxID=2607730 RepID=UPI0011F1F991|nr:hypothetical protein [Aquimarina sp. RZ0]KAA1242379.1 hypothetical protein F0000_25855 [Aquimarina sp. RZ0]
MKVQFGENDTEFTTGVNLGIFFGYTWGNTNFVHRKKNGNKEYNQKITTRLFLSSDKLEFKFNQDDIEQTVKTAFISIGSGADYRVKNKFVKRQSIEAWLKNYYFR